MSAHRGATFRYDAGVAIVHCLTCSKHIPADDVNVAEGVAFCRACGSLSRLADILADAETRAETGLVDLGDPPAGCVFKDDGDVTRVIARCRSTGSVIGSLFICGFWNGIVSVFVVIALAGTIHQIYGSVPSWFPQPSGSNGSSGMFNSVGGLLFMWLFLTPFILVGAALLGWFLTAAFGRCEVQLQGQRGTVFTGVGPIGWRRRFDTERITTVQMGKTTWTENDEHQPCLLMEADSTIRFASMMSRTRRAWMLGALRSLLRS